MLLILVLKIIIYLFISIEKKWANILLNLNGGFACIQVFIQKNSIFFDQLYDPLDNFL
jgi:hypothetical protein